MSSRSVGRFVRETVSDKVSLVATDEAPRYKNVSRRWLPGVPHGVVTHSEGQYVRGVIHTQTIDNFWSLLKRGIIGNYHQVSDKYLPLYLAEFTFRYNKRRDPDLFGEIVAGC